MTTLAKTEMRYIRESFFVTQALRGTFEKVGVV